MKKIVIAVASLMVAGFAQASDDVAMLEVEMTPIVKEAPKGQTAAKWDTRFANYAVENAAAGGQ